MKDQRRHHITEALLEEMKTGVKFEPGIGGKQTKGNHSPKLIHGKGDDEDETDAEFNFPERFMSKKQLHDELNIPRETVNDCIKNGKVKETHFPGSKAVRYWAPSVEDVIKTHNRKK